ncbi:hypothetical protein DLAC_10456 [Tieghemostelium lacteum]|uniref:Uncharacterized protein n=1 Tax=Tieghemostelium lacteum TaxID=361077 RepID=A0A151Z5I8_TIELA|nr:hypothetical protein DLAC_10456 [Tieghemostelium lacteum]|eukprot:KYQ89211.1 hypothetical protein DLAC_10456 [Tieghemostelium lacteum]
MDIQNFKPKFIEIFNELCIQVKDINSEHVCLVYPKEQFGKGISKLIEFEFTATIDQLEMTTNNLPIVNFQEFHFKLYLSHPQILFDNFENIIGSLKYMYIHSNQLVHYINVTEILNDYLNLPGFLHLLDTCPKEVYQRYCNLVYDYCEKTRQTLLITEFLMKITSSDHLYQLIHVTVDCINIQYGDRSIKLLFELCKHPPILNIVNNRLMYLVSHLLVDYFNVSLLPLEMILTESPTTIELETLLEIMRKRTVDCSYYLRLIEYLNKVGMVHGKIMTIFQQQIYVEKSNGGHGLEWLKKSSQTWHYLYEFECREYILESELKIDIETPKINNTIDDFLSVAPENKTIRALFETLLYPGFKFTTILNEMLKSNDFENLEKVVIHSGIFISDLKSSSESHFCSRFILINFTSDLQIRQMMKLINMLNQLDPELKKVILGYLNAQPPSEVNHIIETIWQEKIKILKDLCYSSHHGFYFNDPIDTNHPTHQQTEIPVLPNTIFHHILRQMIRFYPFGMNDLYSIAMASKSFFSVVCHLIKNFKLKKTLDEQLEISPNNIGKLIDIHSKYSILNSGIYHLSTQRLFSFHYQSIETIFYQLTSLEINTSFIYIVERELPNLLKLTVNLTNNNITMLRNLILYCPILEKIKLSLIKEFCPQITTLFEEIFVATKNSICYIDLSYYYYTMKNHSHLIENIKTQCQSFKNQYNKFSFNLQIK